MNPLWTLAPAGVVCGAAILWVFRRIADGDAIHTALNRIQARLLEFWLFMADPQSLWQSWKGLLAANGRFLRLLGVPLVVLSVATLPLFFFLDALYSTAALPVDRQAVVTMAFDRPLDAVSPLPELQAPAGIAVETPAVRVPAEWQVSWRIRPLRPVAGELVWAGGAEPCEKSVRAGAGFHSPRRARGLALLLHPAEAPLPSGPVEWIEVAYPSAEPALFGVEAHWSIWFLAFSLIGMLLAHRVGA
jgi:hypothetical protein